MTRAALFKGTWTPSSGWGVHGRPRQESNLRTRFRKPLLYPLSYGGGVGALLGAKLARGECRGGWAGRRVGIGDPDPPLLFYDGRDRRTSARR